MIVLGIETSCDETAAALVDDKGTILAHEILSQLDDHRPYGGVVPEIAARAHLDHLDGLVRRAMYKAGLDYKDLDGVAATAGPGLIGGVMVGLMTAKAIALAADKPLLAVNHLEAHALTVRMTDHVAFPFLLLLVSGGHCQLLHVRGLGDYQLLGQTIDDAVGEAFDKTAKMMGLPYPGGPEMEKIMAQANPQEAAQIDLPRPMLGRKNSDFSFAGLKTAVHTLIGDRVLSEQDKANIAWAFHHAVGDILMDRLQQGLLQAPQDTQTLVVAGGVAANRFLRQRLHTFCDERDLRCVVPPIGLCTDNAAMIAWVGIEKLQSGSYDSLDVAARPRWPLQKP